MFLFANESRSQITPAPSSSASLSRGYLHLDAAYLARLNGSPFTLTLPLAPRLVRPHPFTLQRIAALARGPLIYCLEDVDHPWVSDHFKSLVLAPGLTNPPTAAAAAVEEEEKTDLPLEGGETYIGITLKKGGIVIPPEELTPALEANKSLEALVKGKERVDLHFVPYWARANRGGKHQMRVGIRTLD